MKHAAFGQFRPLLDPLALVDSNRGQTAANGQNEKMLENKITR